MRHTLLTTLTLLTVAAACSTSDEDEPAPAVAAQADREGRALPPTTQPHSTTPWSDPADAIEGTIVRFASPDVQVDVTITKDNPTTRDFLSVLPLTIRFEDFNRREKIGYLPRELDTDGSPGHDPHDGDLIYFAPWGNVGFYYNAEGVGHDDRVIHLGTYDATRQQLAGLEAGDVTVDVAG